MDIDDKLIEKYVDKITRTIAYIDIIVTLFVFFLLLHIFGNVCADIFLFSSYALIWRRFYFQPSFKTDIENKLKDAVRQKLEEDKREDAKEEYNKEVQQD
jgi:hypothetical protein